MKHEPENALTLIWATANVEANMGGDSQIRPHHFFIAMLKFADPDFWSRMYRLGVAPQDASACERIAFEIRCYLEMSPDELKRTRRALRAKHGVAPPKPPWRTLHRSDDARKAFRTATRQANPGNQQKPTTLGLLQTIIDT